MRRIQAHRRGGIECGPGVDMADGPARETSLD